MSPLVDILLVDDEPRNLDALEVILSDQGYRLLKAGDADQALHLLLENDVAAIVLDIKMPGVSGFELARMIKNTKRFRETPIVFLTAYLVDDQDVIAGYGAGGVDYLTKPINPQILRHKVAVFADLFRKTRELALVNAELARLNERLEERVNERTAELQKSEAALRAAAAQKDEFLAVLAHELRNPLAPLRTGLDLLLRYQSGSPSERVSKTLGAMNRQLDHMVRLIDDLLDVSRISRGLLELKREHVDLGATLRTTIESVRPLFERRNHDLGVDVADDVFAFVDPTRAAQIFTNLLHNAAKFTPQRGSIRIELGRSGGEALLRVSDSGAGIRADQLERVFEMFARIERPGVTAEPGLGIGLALARRLANLHGGSLAVSSEGEGRGATFELRVPLAAEQTAPATLPPGSANGASMTSLSIVVVEDNEDIAEVLREWLATLGHRVTAAGTGGEGLAAIDAVRPDLVICDLGLPDIHGLEVCRRVHERAVDRQPVMIALTGWGREDDIRASKEAGFDYHLVKPVAPERLHALLDSVSASRESASSSTAPSSSLHP